MILFLGKLRNRLKREKKIGGKRRGACPIILPNRRRICILLMRRTVQVNLFSLRKAKKWFNLIRVVRLLRIPFLNLLKRKQWAFWKKRKFVLKKKIIAEKKLPLHMQELSNKKRKHNMKSMVIKEGTKVLRIKNNFKAGEGNGLEKKKRRDRKKWNIKVRNRESFLIIGK